MNDIQWNKIALAEFRSLACLSDEEDIVLQDWADEKSIVDTSMSRSMSTRKVDKLRNQIRKKYDAVQIYTPLLPERNSVK